MNHWLILLLTAVAMVAILVLFAWWWTTDNWDWASAELKPPRTVNTEPKPSTVERLAHHWRMLETLSDLVEIQTQQRKKLEERVRVLEERLDPMENQLMRLHERVTALEATVKQLEVVAGNQSGINQMSLRSREALRDRIRALEAAPLSTDSLPDTETPAEQGSTKTLSYSELFPASQGGTPKP